MIVRLAVLLFACASAAAVANETAEVRAARFYAAGLEAPLFQIRNGVMLVQACAKRLRRGCDKQQRELAGSNRTLVLLDELTLFPQRPAQDPAAGISKASELRQKISETGAELLRAAGEYDRLLFARYGATLRACPDDGATVFRESLEELVRVDLTGFQSLADEDLAMAREAIARDEESIAASLHRSAEDCVAARRLGEYLMQLMDSKLQPWIGEKERIESAQNDFRFGAPKAPEPTDSEKRRQDRELAHAVAGNFVTVLATELQLTVFPESESRIKAVADGLGMAP
jgi:hypothetical protein